MCDTLVALPGATARGATLFAKNSDRERNEAQGLEWVPAARHAPGGRLRATYIEIPRAEVTHACLLSRPFWMWGAEMGANEHGLVIGNEAVHSVVPAQRRRALTGMDLVRLGLERAVGAAEAVEVITGLLQTHGQGGDCGHLGRFFYHNSFLIADRREAFVLETVGRDWALERVRAIRAISNALSIGAEPADGGGFAARLMDRARDQVTRGVERCARALSRLAAVAPAVRVGDMAAVLRDHGPAGGDTAWSPADIVGRTICMHAGPGDRRSQTVAALVSELGPGPDVHWVTAGAAPCLSLFKPVLFAAGLPDQGPWPTDRHHPASAWWRREGLHRAVLADYPARARLFHAERDALEASFRQRIDAAIAAGAGPEALKGEADACWREADAAEVRWRQAVLAFPLPPGPRGAYGRSWSRLNAVAGFPKARE